MKASISTKFAAIILVAAALLPAAALAHTLETHSTVGALFHIDPNDHPVARQPATIYVELQDKSGKLTPANCNCKLAISKDEKGVYSQPIFSDSSSSLATQIPFTFPDSGLYTVTLVGQPEAEIESFTLRYPVEVRDGSSAPEPAPASTAMENSQPSHEQNHAPVNHTAHYIIFGGGGLAVFGYLGYVLFIKPKKSEKPKDIDTKS